MSSSADVSIQKSVDIDVDFSIDCVRCNACGHDSEFTANVDGFGDIQICIEPHSCDE